MNRFLSLFLLCALTVPLWAADPVKIEVTPAKVTVRTTEYQSFKFAASAEVKSWKFINLDPSIVPLTGPGISIDPGYAYYRFTKKGTWWLTVIGVTDKFEIVEARVEVQAVSESESNVDPPKPEPKVEPKPEPKIIPPAVVKKKIAYMVAIEETADASAKRETYLNSDEVQGVIKDIVPYNFDKDLVRAKFSDPAVKENVTNLVKNCKSLPWLFLITAAGEAVYSGPFPNSAAELAGLIKKYGS